MPSRLLLLRVYARTLWLREWDAIIGGHGDKGWDLFYSTFIVTVYFVKLSLFSQKYLRFALTMIKTKTAPHTSLRLVKERTIKQPLNPPILPARVSCEGKLQE